MKIKDSLKFSKLFFVSHWKRSILVLISMTIIVFIVIILLATLQSGLDSGKQAINEYYNKNNAQLILESEYGSNQKISKDIYNDVSAVFDNDVICEYETTLSCKNSIIGELGLLSVVASRDMDNMGNSIFISQNLYDHIKKLGVTDEMLISQDFWKIEAYFGNNAKRTIQFSYVGVKSDMPTNYSAIVSLKYAYEKYCVDTNVLKFQVNFKNSSYSEKVKIISLYNK